MELGDVAGQVEVRSHLVRQTSELDLRVASKRPCVLYGGTNIAILLKLAASCSTCPSPSLPAVLQALVARVSPCLIL